MSSLTTWTLEHLDTCALALGLAWWAAIAVAAAAALALLLGLGRKRRGLAILSLGALLLAVLATRLVRVTQQQVAQLRGCRGQAVDLAAAVDAFASNHDGKLPQHLEELCPTYLRQLPLCPATGTDTYSASYTATTESGVFTLACTGQHHRVLGAELTNLPAYSNRAGVYPPETP